MAQEFLDVPIEEDDEDETHLEMTAPSHKFRINMTNEKDGP